MAIKSSISLFLLFTLFMFIGCSGSANDEKTDDSVVTNPEYGVWQDAAIQPITFERVLTIGNNEDFILPSTYQITGPATDKEGNIYFINGKNGTLYSIDSEGQIRWKTGNLGKGPGDFLQPQGLTTNGKHLYTANMQGSRLDKFNRQGEHLNSSTLEQFDIEFGIVKGFISDSLLILDSSIPAETGQKITVLNVNDSLEKVSQFKIKPIQPLDFAPGLSLGFDISIVDTLIATGNIKNYTLQFFDWRGNWIKNISRDFDGLVRPAIIQRNGRRAVANYSLLYAPVDLKNDYFLTPLSYATNVEDPNRFVKQSMEGGSKAKSATFKNSIDLYNADGTLLYSIENDGGAFEIGNITHVDSEGFLYTKSDIPFPQIRKYKVTISPPTTETDDVLNQ